MSIIATLRAKRQNREVATVTVATDATHERFNPLNVAKVATVTVAKPTHLPCVANQLRLFQCTSQNTWPHTEAMNPNEVETLKVRLSSFANKGLSADQAELLAYKLVIRDREEDNRKLCLECVHLKGLGQSRWRCSNWQRAFVTRHSLARDLVFMLQRCPGFRP